MGYFVAHAESAGMLVIVYNNESDIHYSEALLSQNTEETNVSVSGLSGNAYTVSVFEIDERGLPFNKAAASPRRIPITEGVFSELD